MCEYQHNCGFMKYLKSVDPGITRCVKPDPDQCIRNMEARGVNVQRIQVITGTTNLHNHEDILTREEIKIVASEFGYEFK